MIKIYFSEGDVDRLQDMALNHPHPFVRRKAFALLLKSRNIPHQHIAKTLGICENTFRGYCKTYLLRGLGFVTEVPFRKPKGALEPFTQIVSQYLKTSPPMSIKQAIATISKLTGVNLRETQMRHFLKSIGAKFLKVGSLPSKANPSQQQEFKEQKLEPRIAEAKAGKRHLIFIDSAHFVYGAFLGFLWCLARVFIRAPSGRQRFNVLGALDAITHRIWTVSNETYITATEVCLLLKLIVQSTRLPVTIVLDNARYQRCKLVMAQALELNIELLFLPPYAPNLNLIERLWKFTKKCCLNSTYYDNFVLFRESITDFLEHVGQTHNEELKSLLTLNFQIFTEEQIVKAA